MSGKRLILAAMALTCGLATSARAQTPPAGSPPPAPSSQAPAPQANYIVGAQDVLIITSYDQPELTGKFTVETDGSFSYPLVGRVRVAGLTLRDVESLLKKTLVDQKIFNDPQLTVAIEQYRSQKIYVVGEVRTPGAYTLSGDMRLVEALALAGSTTPGASGEAVIVRTDNQAVVVDPSGLGAPHTNGSNGEHVVRIDLRELENGDLSQNVPLRSGDTIFVLRAESVYVFGQVKNPGAYPLRQRNTTVLQALSLAGGVTDRGSLGRIQIVRIVDGKKQEIRADLTDFVMPRDTIIIPERFF